MKLPGNWRRWQWAQTVAHDAHNLLVAGTNDADMALAANTLIECGGGLCAVADGKVLALIPLACLPELRLTNRGLVDCRVFSFAELFAE